MYYSYNPILIKAVECFVSFYHIYVTFLLEGEKLYYIVQRLLVDKGVTIQWRGCL